MPSRIIELEPSEYKWNYFINPNCFIELEENIEREKSNLKKLYDGFEKNPSNRMIFLAKEKKILKHIDELETRKYDLLIHYDITIDFLHGKINLSNTDYPFCTEVNRKTYYFQLNFDHDEYRNSNREYYIEVSSESATSGFKKIRLAPDDSDMKIQRKARDFTR